MDNVLLTAAEFENFGGWQLDTQFIVNMGTPYLLAHGLGTPVVDAVTTAKFPSAGAYRLWVYTYNWVAPWKPNEAPGRFQISVDGTLCKPEFGASCDTWGWEDGGIVTVSGSEATVSVKDLTGFEGRFGLLFFTKDLEQAPSGELAEIRSLLQQNAKEKAAASYDIVVCGGGIAGICAALSAARNGLRVALVQDRPMVGGNNSSEVRVWLGGKTNFDPLPGVGNIVNELEQKKVGHYGSVNQPENYEDDKKLTLLQAEPLITLYLEQTVTSVRMNGSQIAAVEVWDYKKNGFQWLESSLFVDSTGDATVGHLADADYEVTTNGHMGMTNFWYVEDTEEKQSFPSCPWAVDLAGVPFPGKIAIKDVYNKAGERSLGCWFWEGGCEVDPIAKAEYARDMNFRAMYGAWDCLKNVDHDYETYRLGFSAHIGGKRESRRLLGDIVLTKSDVSKGVSYPDACVPSTWNFDVHYPDRRFYEAFREGDAFITKDYHESFQTPYFVPYRCFYSRNVENLFMAGRNVSVSHDALGTVRVMRTGGMMGEIIGYAAALCKKHQALPRALYECHLEEFMNALRQIPKNAPNPWVSNV